MCLHRKQVALLDMVTVVTFSMLKGKVMKCVWVAADLDCQQFHLKQSLEDEAIPNLTRNVHLCGRLVRFNIFGTFVWSYVTNLFPVIMSIHALSGRPAARDGHSRKVLL